MTNIEKYNAALTQEQRVEKARTAGIASAEAKKKAKSWKESVKNLMAGSLSEADAIRIKEKFRLETSVEELTQQDKVIAAIAEKAQHGDKDCAVFLRDTAGESPAAVVKLGNLDDKPFQMLDLGSLSDEELRNLAQREQPEPVIIDLEPVDPEPVNG